MSTIPPTYRLHVLQTRKNGPMAKGHDPVLNLNPGKQPRNDYIDPIGTDTGYQ